jgi:hypothetical protein
MKLSDMFSSLAENARAFEERSATWQSELTARNDEMMSGIKKWQETATERQDHMQKQMKEYFDQAGDSARTQWENMQKSWEDQFAAMKAKGEEMRESASKMKGGDFASWSEAYAAQMVGFAQKMQDEATNAIASATEVRAKTTKKKT